VHGIARFDAKARLLAEVARDRNVLHLGAVGETLASPEERAAAAPTSVHALLTSVARACVGVDIDSAAVRAIVAAGVFDNLIAADATTIERSSIALPAIDVIVASDVIEHLANPGRLLGAARRLADPHTRLVVTTPNASAVTQFARYVLGRAVEGDDHKVSFNVYSLRHLLASQGWEVERVATCHQSKASGRVGRLFPIAAAALRRAPSLGGTLFALCRPVERPSAPLAPSV